MRKIEYPIGKFGDIRDFVSKTVFDSFKADARWFVSDNIVKVYDFLHQFFNDYYKELDSNVDYVLIKVNDWYYGGSFNNRGLRTYDYIASQLAQGVKTAKLSQHIGGSTNAIDFNVILYFKGGKTLAVNSSTIYDLILKYEKEFIAAGLTTLEDKTIATTWTHADCRYTGSPNIFIVKP